ncbi:pteridine reductase [Methylophilales bacterium HTCC2181]|uniref:Pteridine reductase n=1 Tax=Methylophilales bacterium HTCC2181 TaxID=383631 RepID=A0P4J4_9PROT|nr:pteridine reductase [Methylophilales bacterium HTCC2181]
MNKINRIALVTGSAKRIGASIARHLHSLNINIMIHHNNSNEEASRLAIDLNNLRANSAATVQANLLDSDACTKVISEVIATFGQLDFLINNASSYYPTPITSINQEDWDDLMGTNLRAPLMLSQSAVKYLEKTRGSIINITDAQIQNPKADYIVYSIAKSGLMTLTRSLAKDLSPNIRVNAVAPGAILWPSTNQEIDEQYREDVISKTLLKKMGSPEDICSAVEYLLVHATYVTGQTITVDGGREYS